MTMGHLSMNRRDFLIAGGLPLFGVNLANVAAYASPPNSGGRKIAKSTILIFLVGGASHIDTWDMKPNAIAEYRGPFRPIATTVPGIFVCEYLPRVAQQMHHLAIVRSVGDRGLGQNDHVPAIYYNLTAHAPEPNFPPDRPPRPDDWPSMGSAVALKRPGHTLTSSAIQLPWNFRNYPGQLAGRLGRAYDPLIVQGTLARPLDFTIPALALPRDVPVDCMLQRGELLRQLDQAWQTTDQQRPMRDFGVNRQRALAMLASQQTQAAFDIRREPEFVRALYGPGVNAMSMLLARRLVEAGVPFVTVMWMEDPSIDSLGCLTAGSWDTHGNNFICLKERLLPAFDRPFAALLDDLHLRGLLDETLVVVASEMGRKPRIGDPRSSAGRDHWTACMSVLFAGAGIRGGQVYGASDARAEYPADKPVGPEHIAHTVFHAMGIDDLHATDREGRPFHLMEDGRPLTELF